MLLACPCPVDSVCPTAGTANPMRAPSVTVVIITKDRPDDLRDCLSSLAVQTSFPREIVVVDSSRTDATEKLCAALSDKPIKIRYRHEPRPGFPVARNLGLWLAPDQWVAFTDDDCIVDRDWVTRIQEGIQRHPDAAALAGKSESLYPDNPVAYAANANERYWKTAAIAGDRITDLETLDNKNVAYNKSFLASNGIVYDETRTRYSGASDDCDLGMQIQQKGGAAYYLHTMVVRHKDPRTLRAYIGNKLSRALAHATYERKWSVFRRSGAVTANKSPKAVFFIRDARSRGTSFPVAVGAAAVLTLTFIVIRGAKTIERLRSRPRPLLWAAGGMFLLLLLLLISGGMGLANRLPGCRYFPLRCADMKTVPTPDWWTVNLKDMTGLEPVISDTALLIAGKGGTVYAIDIGSGVVKWQYHTRTAPIIGLAATARRVYAVGKGGAIFSLDADSGRGTPLASASAANSATAPPLTAGNALVYPSADGRLIAVDDESGKPLWTVPAAGARRPSYQHGIVYFSDATGLVRAVDAVRGNTKWVRSLGKQVTLAPAAEQHLVIATEPEGVVRALDENSGETVWVTEQLGAVHAPAAAGGGHVVVKTDKSVCSLVAATGKLAWCVSLRSEAGLTPAVTETSVFVTDLDGALHALKLETGESVWTYRETDAAVGRPAADGQTIYMVNGNGYVRALETAAGKPHQLPRLHVIPLTRYVPAHGIAEFALTSDDMPYANPQTEMPVTATFKNRTNPKEKQYTVHGFYYGKNEWRVRFAPPSAGEWEWRISAATSPLGTQTESGILTCPPEGISNFLAVSASNPFRLQDRNGRSFQPVGLNDVLLPASDSGAPFDNMHLDGTRTDLDTYLRTYSEAGFNVYRWGVDNFSFPLEDRGGFSASAPPLLREGLWGDELVEKLHDNNMRIMMTLFGLNIPYAGKTELTDLQDTKKRRLIEDYVRYVVARYGAYVDIWELANEAFPPKEWVDLVVTALQTEDPYHHLTTISYEGWSRTDKRLTVTSPHWYETEPESMSDLATYNLILGFKWGKPVIVGEQGNRYVNWDPQSALRMRIRLWTSFFAEGALVFWNTSNDKQYVSPSLTSNIYLGPEERQFVRVFREFADKLDPSAVLTGWTEHDGSREYHLEGGRSDMGYIHHYASHAEKTVVTISFQAKRKGTIEWFDPATGASLEKTGFTSSDILMQEASPPFVVDIAYIVKFDE
jgi:outer membrane protein assembly factor BamB/glycosyltransferase involved in cell wall biosynthesis